MAKNTGVDSYFGVAQRKRGGPITLRSLDRNQAPKVRLLRVLFLNILLLPFQLIVRREYVALLAGSFAL